MSCLTMKPETTSRVVHLEDSVDAGARTCWRLLSKVASELQSLSYNVGNTWLAEETSQLASLGECFFPDCETQTCETTVGGQLSRERFFPIPRSKRIPFWARLFFAYVSAAACRIFPLWFARIPAEEGVGGAGWRIWLLACAPPGLGKTRNRRETHQLGWLGAARRRERAPALAAALILREPIR